MRLVFDTNVIASALLWGGTPRHLLQAGRENRIALFTSLALLAELSDILGRRKFDKKIAASLMPIDQLVDGYADLASVVRPVALVGVAPDPDDDVVIGTALAAQLPLTLRSSKISLFVCSLYRGKSLVRRTAFAALKHMRKMIIATKREVTCTPRRPTTPNGPS